MQILRNLWAHFRSLFENINSLIESDWEYTSDDDGRVVKAVYKNDPTHFKSWEEYIKGDEMVAHIRARLSDENYSYVNYSKTNLDELRSLGYID